VRYPACTARPDDGSCATRPSATSRRYASLDERGGSAVARPRHQPLNPETIQFNPLVLLRS